MAELTHRVFVYGTLMNDDVVRYVCGRVPQRSAAKLVGYKKVGLNIIESATSEVLGYVLEVTPEELKSLDQYEGVPYLYKRISVEVGSETVFAYQKTSSNIKITGE